MGIFTFRMQLFLILIVAASNSNAVRKILPFWLAAAIRLTQIPGEQLGNCLWQAERLQH